LLIGDSGVGKSCLLRRFTDREFSESSVFTIGVDFKFRSLTIRGKVVKLQLWDTAGQERFRTLTTSFYRGAQGVMLVYDTKSLESFEALTAKWVPEVEANAEAGISRILVGNKADMGDRKVTREMGVALAAKLGIPFMETSAKTSENVERAFMDMGGEMFRRLAAPALDAARAAGTDLSDDHGHEEDDMAGGDGYVVVDRAGVVDLSTPSHDSIAPAGLAAGKKRRTKNIAGNPISRKCCT